ncbi:MAG: TldD/PmbA family protein [Firmicutes bacterium]|nr:TldD/PmbA family protein [Bacillota bacterium]
MLQRDVICGVLREALSTGGDFAEIFVEDTLRSVLRMVNGRVEEGLSGREHGVGIRIYQGLSSVYAYTSDSSRSGLLAAARQAAAAIDGVRGEVDIVLTPRSVPNGHPVAVMPHTVTAARKAELLHRAHRAASTYDPFITQVRTGIMDEEQNILVANSHGLLVEDQRVRTRFTVQAVASKGGEKQTGSSSPGRHMGFELFEQVVDVEKAAQEAARSAVTMVNADLCPSGQMPVVIANEFGGVIFHEACGHGLEATSVAKGHSVFANKLGERIASEWVTAIDDGTIPNAWGSANIDDEGTPTRRNVLIEKGILTGYLVDRLNGRRMNMEPTGSGRRQSYKFAPTSRMSNTYIAAGPLTPEEIIADTETGLYARYMGGGSVNPATGEFNFAVQEGYLIKDGEIAQPVRGATLIGKGSEVLLRIDRVANDLGFGQGMCGSASGSIPADVGQPTIRVSSLTVGGRKEAR